MSINIVLFGQAGVGKSSIVKLLAAKKTAVTSAGPRGRDLRSHQYTFTLMGKTFNIWDTIGLGEPTFAVSKAFGAIEEIYVLIRQFEQQGGLHLLLYCIPGARITQTTLNNYRLFFEVLCDKRIPIAVVVTRLESEERMEDWWLRNREHVTRCGLEFSGHACVTGLSYHSNAAQSRAALESLLRDFDPRGNLQTLPSSYRFSSFLERLPTAAETSTVKHYKTKELERLLRDRCMMDSVTANQLTKNLTRVLDSSSSNSRSASPPLRDRLVTPLRHFPINWFQAILRLSFPIHDDDIVVFLVGPSRSRKSMFIHAVAQAHGFANVGPTLQLSTRDVQAIRFELTEEGRTVLRTKGPRNFVFVDTPSFFTDPEGHIKAVNEMSTWLKRSKSKSTCFGTIYLHPIDVDPDKNSSYRVQRQLDTFAGTFPPDLVTRAFPQRLHCVCSSYSKISETEILRHWDKFQKQLSELRPRVVNGWRPKWETSIHPELFMKGDPDTAWKVVEALFSSP